MQQQYGEQTATPRVAVLNPADGLAEAILEAQMEIGYFHVPQYGVEHLEFESIPIFDAVAAVLPADPDDLRQQTEFAFLFVRARRPASFMLVVHSDAAVSRIARRADELGYEIQTHRAAGRVFVVGTLPGVVFAWPEIPSQDTVKAGLIAAAVRIRDAVLREMGEEEQPK